MLLIGPTLCFKKRRHFYFLLGLLVLGSQVVIVLDRGAEGPGSNRSRDAVG